MFLNRSPIRPSAKGQPCISICSTKASFRPCKNLLQLHFLSSLSSYNQYTTTSSFYRLFIGSTTFKGAKEPAQRKALSVRAKVHHQQDSAKMTADTDVHSSMPKNMDTSKSAPKPSLLCADDYSLSSPASSTKSETPNSSALPTPLSLPASRESAKNLDPLATHRLPQHLPLASPNNETLLTPLMSRHHQDYFGNTSPGTATAERHDLSPHTASSGSRSGSTSGSGVKSVLAKIQASFPEQQRRYNLSSHPLHPSQPSQYFDAPVPVPANSRKGKGYNTYESCMEGEPS